MWHTMYTFNTQTENCINNCKICIHTTNKHNIPDGKKQNTGLHTEGISV